MEWIKLGELCEVKGGQGAPQNKEDYSDRGIPFIRAGNLEDLINSKSLEVCDKIEKEIGDKRKLKLQPKNTVVFAKSGMSCLKSYIYRLDKDCYVVNHLACLTVTDNKLNSKYLSYVLNYIKPKSLINDLSYPSIRLRDISKMEIPIPPIKIQKQIVEALDKAQALIDNRKEQVNLLDDLIESIFYDMFGDPVRNDRGWEVAKLENNLEFIKYGVSTPPVFKEEGACFIRATNIDNSRINSDKMLYLGLSEQNRLEDYKLELGYILIVRSGVNAGDSAYVTSKYVGGYAGYDLFLEVNKKKLNYIFLIQIFQSNFKEKIIKPLTRRAAQPHINAAQVKSLNVITPPIQLQNEFAAKVEEIESQKQLLEESLELLENNYNSIMQRAFKGELFKRR